jgi:glutamyl-tRNA synthetase
MHLGNVRTALFSWLLARRSGGRFLLRIEDTDHSRNTEDAYHGILEVLEWLGLTWDEGPGQDRGSGPYRQSDRGDIYIGMYGRLDGAGLTYHCFCSPETLAVQRKRLLAAGKPPRYPGTCAKLSDEQVAEKRAQGPAPTLRFRVPAGRMVAFDDLVHGPQQFNTDDIGDFIIRRADGSAAFFFCNAVDDALMGVTHVLRGEDHLANTPRQLLLLEALGFAAPAYGHVNLIVGSDGTPLSKRHGSASAGDLRARGILPGAVVNMLARLGHHYESGDYLTLEALAQDFDLKHLGTAPAHFDEHQLQHWQREAILHADTKTLSEWVKPTVRSVVPESELEDFSAVVKGNVLYPEESRTWAQTIYMDLAETTPEAADLIRQLRSQRDYVNAILDAVSEAKGDYSQFVQQMKARTPLRGKALFQPLRAALTGRLDGPELASLFKLMGAERIRRRLEKALC